MGCTEVPALPAHELAPGYAESLPSAVFTEDPRPLQVQQCTGEAWRSILYPYSHHCPYLVNIGTEVASAVPCRKRFSFLSSL